MVTIVNNDSVKLAVKGAHLSTNHTALVQSFKFWDDDDDDDDGSDGTADVMYDDANGKEVVILVLYMGEFDIADILHTFITLISILSCSGSPREIISFSRNSTWSHIPQRAQAVNAPP